MLLFAIGGVAAGLAPVGFANLAEHAQALFSEFASGFGTLVWFVSPLGLALSTYLARRYFPGSQGSGIPQCVAAITFEDEPLRARLMAYRIMVGKILLTLMGLLSGASIGREGPSVQIGASLMWGLRGALQGERTALILAGSGAGIAAAFNAPLAGFVFAVEELSSKLTLRTGFLAFVTTMVAGATAIGVTGKYPYLGALSGGLTSAAGWAGMVVIAVAGGILGGLFSRLMIAMHFNKRLRHVTAIDRHPVLFAGLCGLVIAVCGLLSGGLTYGSGYGEAYDIVHGGSGLSWTFMPLKFIATTASSLSGVPGGLFLPSLSVGAGLGKIATLLFPSGGSSEMQFAVLGMTAYLAGVIRAPVTSAVLMSEMTQNGPMILPFFICAIIANAVSKRVSQPRLYHALAANFMPRGITPSAGGAPTRSR